MLATERIRSLSERLAPYGDRVISLYLDVNPASVDNQRKAWVLRARAAMEALGLPNGSSRRIAERLRGQVLPEARTLAVFAHPDDEELFTTVPIEHSLRAVTGHDGALARFGEPFLAPIQLNLLRRRPSLVLQIVGDRIRLFVVGPGSIEELEKVQQDWDETFWRTDEGTGSTRPGETQRGGSPKDAYEERTENWIARLYKRVAGDLRRLVDKHGACRVILSGTAPDVAAFEAELDPAAAALVKARIPLQPNPDASAGSLHERFLEAIREAEEAEGAADLARAEEVGVRGAGPTLQAVNENRVHTLIVPDVPYQEVWRCRSSGRVFATRERAAGECGGEDLEPLPLADVLPRLAEDFGMELRFLSGEPDRRLREELGGLAGLLRW
ncbi:MAG TPA: VLRF1 family aeRF1-type release factor [Trueperaceae bacterium]|nr:VLRF1 family aeRF1-type release factor [Trueperaceae bacterium]